MTPYFENDSGVLYCGDMNITISNVKDNLSGVYIGRTSAFGNPYHIGAKYIRSSKYDLEN